MPQDLTKNGPQPINIWLESLASHVKSAGASSDLEREILIQKDEAILLMLGKLALVYWRPDFTPAQAKQLYAQYLDDLRDWALSDVAAAIAQYRQDPENKFYPTPGQLRGLIAKPPSWWVGSKTEWVKDQQEIAHKETLRIMSDPRVQIAAPQRVLE